MACVLFHSSAVTETAITYRNEEAKDDERLCEVVDLAILCQGRFVS